MVLGDAALRRPNEPPTWPALLGLLADDQLAVRSYPCDARHPTAGLAEVQHLGVPAGPGLGDQRRRGPEVDSDMGRLSCSRHAVPRYSSAGCTFAYRSVVTTPE